MKWRKIGIIALSVVLVCVALLPAAYADTGDEENIWNRISVERGTTDEFGGGDYVYVKSGSAFFGVLYGTEENNNFVKILADVERYAGGVDIYGSDGRLISKRILRYHTFVGQQFNFAWEYVDKDGDAMFDFSVVDDNGTIVEEGDEPIKAISFWGAWNMTDFHITNISNEEVRVDFTVERDNIPYTHIMDNTSLGDGVVNKIAIHFHITARLEVRNVTGFPWYRYQRGEGISLDHRENYSGKVVVFEVKYDKEIIGWDFKNESSRVVVENTLFFGVAGMKGTLYMIRHRYGGCGAEIDNTTYDNQSLPMHRRIFRHGDRIVFTGVGNWERVGRFRWESNVTVDNTTKKAYYQIHDGFAYIKRWNNRVFAMIALRGGLIYPAGEHIFQDPSLSTEQMYIDFGLRYLPTGLIALMSIVAIVALAVALVFVYGLRRK